MLESKNKWQQCWNLIYGVNVISLPAPSLPVCVHVQRLIILPQWKSSQVSYIRFFFPFWFFSPHRSKMPEIDLIDRYRDLVTITTTSWLSWALFSSPPPSSSPLLPPLLFLTPSCLSLTPSLCAYVGVEERDYEKELDGNIPSHGDVCVARWSPGGSYWI